jgi:arylsulfatase A-like enzyme
MPCRFLLPLALVAHLGCPTPVESEVGVGAQRTAVPPPPPQQGSTVSPGTVDLQVAAPAGATPAQTGSMCSGCDVVLVSVCSLRRDHLGAYGDSRGLTPTIDALAKTSARFTQAYAGANFTLGSLAAMLTGSFGSSTGVLNWGRGLDASAHTLPEVLGIYGYATGGFSVDAATGFRPDYGLHDGFQRMVIIDPPRDTPDGRFSAAPMGDGGGTAAPMVEWIAKQPKDKPLFAMLHTRSAHFPFVVSKDGIKDDVTGVRRALWEEGAALRQRGSDDAMPGRAGASGRAGLIVLGPHRIMAKVRSAGPAGVRVWRAAYAESVRRMDADIAAVMRGLEARGRLDKTIIVLVADHGESLDDNGEILHGMGFFESVVRVPMLIRGPGIQAGAVSGLVSQVDLMPTLLELVGAVAPEGIDGVSMVPLLRRQKKAVRSTVLVEGSPGWTGSGDLPGAVIAPPFTLLQQSFPCEPPGSKRPTKAEMVPIPKPGAGVPERVNQCLFNLSADPGQQRNLASERPKVVERLLARWTGFRSARAGRAVPVELRLDPAMVEMLRTTGYDFRPLEPQP